MWPPWVGQYLLTDALQIGHPVLPEIKLNPGQGVQPLQQLLCWVLAKDLFNLLEPLDDDGLDGVQHRAVCGPHQAERQMGYTPWEPKLPQRSPKQP